MQVGMIEGATRVVGKSQGYLGLPVKDETVWCSVDGPGTPAMTTAWHPTNGEIEAIVCGASIRIQILGTSHPPIMVTTGPVPQQPNDSSEQTATHNKMVPAEVSAFLRRMVAEGAKDADIMLALESFVFGTVLCLEGMFAVDRRCTAERLEMLISRVMDRLGAT